MWSFLFIPIKNPIVGKYRFKNTYTSFIISTAFDRFTLLRLFWFFEGMNSPAILLASLMILVLSYD